MQSGRLFDIIYLLLDKGSMTTSELSSSLEVSPRTIRRDIEKLSGAGVPVYMTRGKGGGVHLMPNFVLSKSLLSTHEQDEILFALQALQQTGVTDIQDTGLSTHDRLAAVFQKETSDWLDIDFGTWGSTPTTQDYFDICQTGILQQRVLEFDYFASRTYFSQSSSTQPMFDHRSVEPYRLVFRANCWYLQAYCLLRKDWRIFKLSRIRNLEQSNQPFQKRPLVPPFDSKQESFPVVHAHLRFSPRVAFRVLDEFPVEDISLQEDGSLIMEVDVAAGPWVPNYLLSFGGDLEVLDPPEWRSYVKEQAEKITERYN